MIEQHRDLTKVLSYRFSSFPKLTKKGIRFVFWRCFYVFQHIRKATFYFYAASCKRQAMRLHRCRFAGIQAPAGQTSLLAHYHVTDKPISTRVAYRHLGDSQVTDQLIIFSKEMPFPDMYCHLIVY